MSGRPDRAMRSGNCARRRRPLWMWSTADAASRKLFDGDGLRPVAGSRFGLGCIDERRMDSKGNVYVGENFDGRRFQRFVYKGMDEPTGSTLPPPIP